MKKLIIQIPCFNESETLPKALQELPREIEGVDCVEWLVIDDGSDDDTASVARSNGVDHIVSHTANRGLARAFETGINACLELGADVIINTDADNQYSAEDIPTIALPVIRGEADLVVGERPIWQTEHFSSVKKVLQKIGSWSVRIASGTSVRDAPSGFRAFSREAALKLNVFNEFTYTLETIIQAGQMRMAVLSLPIRTNPETRPSRLISSIPRYVARCGMTIVRTFVTYRSFATFAFLGMLSFICGLLISFRFLYFYWSDGRAGHIQSLILAALLLGIGFFLIVVGLIADLISVNRRLLEETLQRVRAVELNQLDQPDRRDSFQDERVSGQ